MVREKGYEGDDVNDEGNDNTATTNSSNNKITAAKTTIGYRYWTTAAGVG